MINKTNISIFTVAAMGSLMFSTIGQAENLTVSSTLPTINFVDTGEDGSTVDWILTGPDSSFNLFDNNGAFRTVLQIIPSANNIRTMIVDSSGDINLADGSVFVDRSLNRLGIGTVTPPEDLSIASTSPTISLNDTDGPRVWEINSSTSSATFDIANITDGNEMFKLYFDAPDNSLVVDGPGVGVGTAIATAKLDVRGDIKATFNGSSTSGLQELFIMSANNTDLTAKSDAGFVLENAREGFSWAFRTDEANGGFSASKQGTGARELELINTTTDATKVELRLANGGANVNGVWLNASSRSYKKNIHELSSDDAMQALRGLKSVKYQYKQDQDNEQKLGFIAEDVPDLVATKDRKTLDPMQIVAVLTRVAQEQDEALLSKDKKIADMESRINQLERLFKGWKNNSDTE